MSVVETVEKQLEDTYEVSRDNLVALKNSTYEKYCEAYDAIEHLKDATLETLSNAWEQAWISYATVWKQLQDYGHSSIEKSQAEYDAAKTNLAQRTRDISDWISQHGEKLQEDASGLQAEAYSKMGTARKEAYEKYLQSKESLKNLFNSAHEEATKDVEAAEKQLKKATSRLENHGTSASTPENKDEWEKIKTKLEAAKQRAQTELDEAKAHSETLGVRLSGWAQDVMQTLKDESEFLTDRAKKLGEQVSAYASESKEKVDQTAESASNSLQDQWNGIYRSAQDDSAYALDIWNSAKDTFANFWQSAKEAVGLDNASNELLKTPDVKEQRSLAEDKASQESSSTQKETKIESSSTQKETKIEPVEIPEGSGVLLQG